MSKTLGLNGFRINLSGDRFSAYTQPIMDTKEYKNLKEKLKESWFLYLKDGIAYGFPKKTTYPKFGQPTELDCQDNLWFIKSKLEDILPKTYENYKPTRVKPFTFLAQKSEIVESATKQFKSLNPLVKGFKIRPKFELEAKLLEPSNEDFYIGLFVQTSTRWDIELTLNELRNTGLDLCGLYVVHTNPLPGQPRLVGRIKDINNGRVTLSEAYQENTNININNVLLEGSKTNFAHCLKFLLGDKYGAFERATEYETTKLSRGDEFNQVVEKMHSYLKKKSPIKLTDQLHCEIGERIFIKNTANHKSIYNAGQVKHCYDAARTKTHIYPWKGIEQFGPFSRDTFEKKSPKILVIFPDTVQSKVENFLNLFREGVSINANVTNQTRDFGSAYNGGFAKIFGLNNVEFELQKIPWLGKKITSPALVYRNFVNDYLYQKAGRNLPDAAMVVILEEHSKLADVESPYLQSKSLLLMSGIPVQHIRSQTLLKSPEELQYTFQNLSVATYAKLNGTPWTVNHDLTINDEIVIGMGACELSSSRFTKNQRFVGITTVFRGDGSYLLSNLSEECSYEKYPEVLKESALRILREIKDRNGWRPNDTIRVVFHVYKPLKDIEIAQIMHECVQTVGAEQQTEFAFLNIVKDHSFTLFDFDQPGQKTKKGTFKGKYAPERGTIVQIGRFTRLLSTSGPSLIKRDITPLPIPLLVNIHPKSTYRSLDYLTEQALRFTALSWRSTAPAPAPVTIYYSELIAEQLARLKSIEGWSPFSLNSKLRSSRWFL